MFVPNAILMAVSQNGLGGTTSSNWSMDKFLENVISKLQGWGSAIVIIIGLIMVIIGLFQLFKGLSSGGRSQVNWVVVILLLLLGGALAFTGGWSLVKNITGGGGQTLSDLGNAMITAQPFFSLIGG